MKTSQKIIAAFLVASSAFLSVSYARGPGCDGDGPMRGASMLDGDSSKMMAQRGNQRLERLHTELKITAQQEPLWQAFAEKTKAEMGKGMQTMRPSEADAKLSAPERMEKMQAGMKERLASMESVNESFKRLYAALSDEQKATADAHFNHMGPAGKKGHHGPERKGPRQGPRSPEPAKG